MTARTDGVEQVALPDMERRLANVIRHGRIIAVDLAAKRVRVKSGNIESAWIPWSAGRANSKKRRWDPPAVGEQVTMLSPGGDMRQAVAIPGLYQTAHDAPSDSDDEDLTEYSDGTKLSYNVGTHTLKAEIDSTSITANQSSIVLTAGGSTITINAAGITLSGAAINLN